MRRLLALLVSSLLAAPALAQVNKAADDAKQMKKQTAQQKKAPAKKAEKQASKPAAKKASSGSDWSQFQGSAQRDLKADEEKRKAKAAKK
jgi:hypothetical protein